MDNFLVGESWWKQRAGAPDLVVIDTRPADEFYAGHLPGARHFDPFPFHCYDTSPKGIAEFNAQSEWIFSALGIDGTRQVLVYEAISGSRATRVAWILEYLGHNAVYILDGGLGALHEPPLTDAVLPFRPARFRAAPQPDMLATYEDILARLKSPDARLLDVRSAAEYYGELVRAKRGGAIPGAVPREWTLNNDARGKFKSPAELRAIFDQLGLRPEHEVIAYCQGGYRAAHTYYALRLAGFPTARNYLGSWGEWGNREELPIETPRRPA